MSDSLITPLPATDDPDSGYHAVQTGLSLLQRQERRQLIRVLSENTPLSQSITESWWLRPLEEMTARVQDCPAAWSGPFSSPGGFIDLSLSVATRAVKLTRGMMLPPGVTPEEQAEQTPGWICAVYWAGLFHHLEWLSQMKGEMRGGKVWYPGLVVPTETWRVRPDSSTAGGMNGTFMACRLLPDAGMVWLRRWPALSDTLLMFLSGRRAESGVLNSIISEARSSCGLKEFSVPVEEKPASHNPPILEQPLSQPLSSLNSMLVLSSAIDSAVPPYTPSAVQAELTKGGAGYLTGMDVQLPVALESAFSGGLAAEEAPETELATELQQDSTENLMSMLDFMAGGQSTVSGSEPEREGLQKSEGELYLAWLQGSIEEGTLTVNESDSVLHILAQFVFLISPVCFYRYTALQENSAVDKDRLQKSFEALAIHHSRNGKGLFHYHKYDTPEKSGRYTKVSGYMINADVLLKRGSCPGDSLWLSAKR